MKKERNELEKKINQLLLDFQEEHEMDLVEARADHTAESLHFGSSSYKMVLSFKFNIARNR